MMIMFFAFTIVFSFSVVKKKKLKRISLNYDKTMFV